MALAEASDMAMVEWGTEEVLWELQAHGRTVCGIGKELRVDEGVNKEHLIVKALSTLSAEGHMA